MEETSALGQMGHREDYNRVPPSFRHELPVPQYQDCPAKAPRQGQKKSGKERERKSSCLCSTVERVKRHRSRRVAAARLSATPPTPSRPGGAQEGQDLFVEKAILQGNR